MGRDSRKWPNLALLRPHQVKVVDDDDAGTGETLQVVGQGTDSIDGCLPFEAEQFARVLADARIIKAASHCVDERAVEPDRVRVPCVAAEPSRRNIWTHREPVGEEGRLAGARSAHHEREPTTCSLVELLEQSRPRDQS